MPGKPAPGDGGAWALAKSLLEPNNKCVCEFVAAEGEPWPVCSVGACQTQWSSIMEPIWTPSGISQ